MTRLETELLGFAEILIMNDNVVRDADYQILASIATDVGEVESENAKLRELLQRTWDVFRNASSREFNAVKRDLRELGIGVD